MANIDAGGGSNKRDLNRDIPLVPFIDFLLCLVSFLLITAIWSQSARLEASAQVPGSSECCKPEERPRRLHVDIRERKFELVWKQGETVLARHDVDRKPVQVAGGQTVYPELARRIREEWQRSGAHKSPSDVRRDEAVLHASNSLEFGEIAAVLDAIGAASRERTIEGQTVRIPAFSVSFAVN
jgi:biopolymer transport protein ExbD